MRTRLLLAAALLACAAPQPRPPSGEVVLSFTGRVRNGPFRYGRDDLPGLPRRAFEATSPRGGAGARFEGVALAPMLGDAMELERDADTAVFRGERGVAVPVPLAVVRQLDPVLADRVDGAPVASWREGARPLQLAWPTRDAPGLDTDPRERWWWPTGVSEVALQSWLRTYGRALRVPVGAPPEARLGADVLATSCIGCHRVRGIGGTAGPALDAASARDGQRFAARLHQHLRAASGYPGAPEVPAATARQVAAFLAVADAQGPLPPDPGAEPPGAGERSGEPADPGAPPPEPIPTPPPPRGAVPPAE